MQDFQNTHHSLLESSVQTIKRELLNSICWSDRLICIKGFRGVGKTTFLLDSIRKYNPGSNDALYVNLNTFYFSQRKIFSFADEFSKLGGKVLFLDQIQKYPNWSQELRLCYERIPDLKIVFTSSPVLRIIDGNPDLEGIARVYHLEGLSFREYLNFRTGNQFGLFPLNDLIENHRAISEEVVSKVRPLAYFGEYLKSGYFPYFIENQNFYTVNLLKNINLALEIDVPYYNQVELKYLPKLRKLLHIIATETPFVPNVSKLASAIDTSRATVMNYLKYLKNARLINLLYEHSDEDQAKKPDKIYMQNTNLLYSIAPGNTSNENLRHTFFYNQVGNLHELKSTGNADFLVDGKYTFIVGGRKTESLNGCYAASDMIETGEGKKIPLWLFGFLY